MSSGNPILVTGAAGPVGDGSAVYNPAQLKTMQEVITFVVFAGFSYLYLQQPITFSQGFGFALIAAGAFFVFKTW